jgi:hypothetical protein
MQYSALLINKLDKSSEGGFRSRDEKNGAGKKVKYK